MASIKPSHYSSFDSQSSRSSQISDPSSSSELKNPRKSQSSHKRIIGSSRTHCTSPDLIVTTENSSGALVRKKSSSLVPSKIKNEHKFSSMVKKFMDTRSKPKASANQMALAIPSDPIAEDLKKRGAKSSNFTSFHPKLYQTESLATDPTETKASVQLNTRTIAMVLRSERELLNQNKEHEKEILELKLTLEEKNREVERLEDLCLKQKEEIKELKNAILFPDVMNSHLQELLEKQGLELKQAKFDIPTLQRQVNCLTGQLQCLVEDLAEMKADKYAVRACNKSYVSSPRKSEFDQEATNSLEFDEMFGYDSPCEEGLHGSNRKLMSSHGGKMFKRSEYCQEAKSRECHSSSSLQGHQVHKRRHATNPTFLEMVGSSAFNQNDVFSEDERET